MNDRLTPAEKLALTVARAQIGRGENPTPNISGVLAVAFVRLADESKCYLEETDE